MTELIFNVLVTGLVFIIFGYLLALVYFNKNNNHCPLCGSKTEKNDPAAIGECLKEI